MRTLKDSRRRLAEIGDEVRATRPVSVVRESSVRCC